MPSALAVIALSERGTMFNPGPIVYMEKLAGADDIADLLDLDRPLTKTIELVAERRGVEIGDIMIVALERDRHTETLNAVRELGARVRLIQHGDVSAAMLAVSERSPVDLLWGIGGTPEGVISAAAIKSLGGGLVGKLWPRDDEERQAALDEGYDLDKQLTQDDLVKGDDCFFAATGVTDGDMLQGVRYQGARSATTESLVMRSRSGTVRRIHARARPHEAARAGLRPLRLIDRATRSRDGAGVSCAAGTRYLPVTDFSRSRRASRRRKPCVTITWIRDCVLVYKKRPRREAIAG